MIKYQFVGIIYVLISISAIQLRMFPISFVCVSLTSTLYRRKVMLNPAQSHRGIEAYLGPAIAITPNVFSGF